jgi:hypothetical protein
VKTSNSNEVVEPMIEENICHMLREVLVQHLSLTIWDNNRLTFVLLFSSLHEKHYFFKKKKLNEKKRLPEMIFLTLNPNGRKNDLMGDLMEMF